MLEGSVAGRDWPSDSPMGRHVIVQHKDPPSLLGACDRIGALRGASNQNYTIVRGKNMVIGACLNMIAASAPSPAILILGMQSGDIESLLAYLITTFNG